MIPAILVMPRGTFSNRGRCRRRMAGEVGWDGIRQLCARLLVSSRTGRNGSGTGIVRVDDDGPSSGAGPLNLTSAEP